MNVAQDIALAYLREENLIGAYSIKVRKAGKKYILELFQE